MKRSEDRKTPSLVGVAVVFFVAIFWLSFFSRYTNGYGKRSNMKGQSNRQRLRLLSVSVGASRQARVTLLYVFGLHTISMSSAYLALSENRKSDAWQASQNAYNNKRRATLNGCSSSYCGLVAVRRPQKTPSLARVAVVFFVAIFWLSFFSRYTNGYGKRSDVKSQSNRQRLRLLSVSVGASRQACVTLLCVF